MEKTRETDMSDERPDREMKQETGSQLRQEQQGSIESREAKSRATVSTTTRGSGATTSTTLRGFEDLRQRHQRR